MYYSAYDLQCNSYFYSGRNSKSKKEATESIIDFLLEGEETEEGKEISNTCTPKEILSIFEVEIRQHKEPLFTI